MNRRLTGIIVTCVVSFCIAFINRYVWDTGFAGHVALVVIEGGALCAIVLYAYRRRARKTTANSGSAD
jgi:hypothetical protein